jgi:hypothetical protein
MDKYCTLYNCDCEEAEFECSYMNGDEEQDIICCQECNFYVEVE